MGRARSAKRSARLPMPFNRDQNGRDLGRVKTLSIPANAPTTRFWSTSVDGKIAGEIMRVREHRFIVRRCKQR